MTLAVDPEKGDVKGRRSHVATTRATLRGGTAEPGTEAMKADDPAANVAAVS